MEILISAISQGLLWGILSVGLFISFRILNIADMTTEGSFPLGACVAVVAISHGINPYIAILISIIFGMLAGFVTGFLITVCKIPSLLAGILTMTALLSVNLRIMGRPNLNILSNNTIFTFLEKFNLPKSYNIIIIGLIFSSIVILIMALFFKTELGQSLIATGDNINMASSLGISVKAMTILGLMLSNGIIAFAGGILAQNNGYADVNSGIGVIVIALAAIIIGEVIFGDVTFIERLIYTVCGAIIYRLLLVLVLKLEILEANDFKLITALIIAIFLTLPQFKNNIFKTRKGN
ncbi:MULTISPECIES: ABC transporter permease [unclassified Gemella]|uniref:ABC transporter permease n=1 Tax=unclassified Gemella TaxID=2624949 RepID=UPI001C04A098|nr:MULTISPECIES: ABC transporter permease [unclassified Gemella]MBU0279105.1 ABC transporter permease [Gemella sp. zg-1178]QWQ39172.1 ABC transporter permease [Gemella sp. zg-570]